MQFVLYSVNTVLFLPSDRQGPVDVGRVTHARPWEGPSDVACVGATSMCCLVPQSLSGEGLPCNSGVWQS